VTNDEPSAERVARNDSIFRDANEKINDAVTRYGVDGRLPFICECADPACTEIVHLDPATYEQIRANPLLFLNARGHNTAGGPYAAVVERGDGYEVIEKQGPARPIAAERDPRA
jgi:hypothetical protein